MIKARGSQAFDSNPNPSALIGAQEFCESRSSGVDLITCFIRYQLNPNKLESFEQYARTWMRLIEKHGGSHHGYFVPDQSPPAAPFSFSDIGEEGRRDMAIALFSFPTIEAYEKYRRDVAGDPECVAATRHFQETQCFTEYERTFVRPVDRDL